MTTNPGSPETESQTAGTVLSNKPTTTSEPADQIPTPPAKPDYLLIALGLLATIVLIALAIFGIPLSPMLQALCIAIALVLLLYGLYPVPAMRGTFGPGLMGTLVVAGPAALGLFVFLFVWHSLKVVPATSRYVLLQNTPDSSLNSTRLASGTEVSLLGVDSLSDDKLDSPVRNLRSYVRAVHSDSAEAQAQVEKMFAKILDYARVDSKNEAAMKMLKEYDDTRLNQEWKQLIDNIAKEKAESDPLFRTRVRRTPFAVAKVKEKGKSPTAELLLPGDKLPVAGKHVDVPVIANPTRRVNGEIQEAVVFENPEPSQSSN